MSQMLISKHLLEAEKTGCWIGSSPPEAAPDQRVSHADTWGADEGRSETDEDRALLLDEARTGSCSSDRSRTRRLLAWSRPTRLPRRSVRRPVRRPDHVRGRLGR